MSESNRTSLKEGVGARVFMMGCTAITYAHTRPSAVSEAAPRILQRVNRDLSLTDREHMHMGQSVGRGLIAAHKTRRRKVKVCESAFQCRPVI